MVQKIKFMNHVIRLFGMTPTTSWAIPESCPSCGVFYNDGQYRKCYYLCCEYIDCLDCVLNHNIFSCPVFDEELTAYKRRLKRKKAREARLSLSSSMPSSSHMETGSISTAEKNSTATTVTATEISTCLNEDEEEMISDEILNSNMDDCDVALETGKFMDQNNNKTDEDDNFDEIGSLKETDVETGTTEEMDDCNVMTGFQPDVGLLLPKQHWKAGVVLERVSGMSDSGLKKRRKKYRRRYDPTVPPSRMSGRIRVKAKNSESEVVMPA